VSFGSPFAWSQEAEESLKSLQGGWHSQNFVICGVSGAGKTETTKLIFQ
jgi:myosin heavy subunit